MHRLACTCMDTVYILMPARVRYVGYVYVRTRATFPGCSAMGVSRWIRACNAIYVCNVQFSTYSNRTYGWNLLCWSLWLQRTFEMYDREEILFIYGVERFDREVIDSNSLSFFLIFSSRNLEQCALHPEIP